jgi:hypothetical protein
MTRTRCELATWWLLAYMPIAALGIATAHAAETFAPRANDDLTKPIRVSPDGHFLTKPDGSPFFYLGENVEALFERLTREDTDAYLANRAERGFTIVLGHVVSRFGFNQPNVYGDRPFLDGEVTRPNPKYFAHIDWVISQANKLGLRVGLIPMNGIEYVAEGQFNVTNAERYGRWLGERYKGKGIVWMLGWDASPVWPAGPVGDLFTSKTKVLVDFRPVYDLMAKGIRDGEGGDPFITFHETSLSFPGTPQPRSSLYLSNRSWLDMNTIQSSHFLDQSAHMARIGADFGWNSTYNYEPIRAEFYSRPVRPIIDAEPQFEYMPRNIDTSLASGRWDEVDVRNSAYHAVFAGAAGHTYNHLAVVHILVPGEKSCRHCETTIHWRDALNAPGAVQVAHIKSLMLSRPYFSRIPDQSVILSEAGEGRRYVSATRDRNGSYIMIYLPEGQPVEVDMIKLSGSAGVAWWFDPRTGNTTRIGGTIPTNQSHRFTPPSSGWGNDWVLVLDDESKGFAPPNTSDAAT